jgi:hypothetical protein
MKKYLLFFSIFIAFLCGATNFSGAVTIDFTSTKHGQAIDDDYLMDGVVFTNAFYSTVFSAGTWASGEADSSYNGVGNVPITGYFLGTTGEISALTAYADSNTTTYLKVYDVSSNLIGQESITDDGWISITAPNIASFVFSWTGGATEGSGFYFDDVVGIDTLVYGDVTPYASVPEPATMLLLCSGLLGLLGVRKKFRKR